MVSKLEEPQFANNSENKSLDKINPISIKAQVLDNMLPVLQLHRRKVVSCIFQQILYHCAWLSKHPVNRKSTLKLYCIIDYVT